MRAQRSVAGRPHPLSAVPSRFVEAKVRGRRSRLREGLRLRALAGEHSVRDLARALYRTEETRDDVELEHRLLAGCVADLRSLSRYLAGSCLRVYRALLDRYLVLDLKVLIRLWDPSKGASAAALPLFPEGEPPQALARLLEARSVEDFIAGVPLPLVRDCAQRALPLFAETGRKAYLEMAFDQGYWLGVTQAAQALPARERRRSMEPVWRELHGLRLLATLRAARVYGMPWEHLEALLPAAGSPPSVERLQNLYARPDAENVLSAVPWPVLSPPAAEDAEDPDRFERWLWGGIQRAATRQRRAAGALAVLIAYYYSKRNEFQRLTGLTQMLRYGMGTSEIVQSLELPASAD